MKQILFQGSGVAIVTPMKADQSVDYDTLGKLLEFQVDNGTDAIIICGTTGESSTLTHEEHCDVIRYTIQKIAGRIPVIAGTGSNHTDYAIALSQEAKNMGADGILVVTPYYNKTSQAGLIQHYYAIADAVDIPMIVYNVPSRTGCGIQPATYLELSKHPNIVAVKEANGNIDSVAKTAALCGDNLTIYSGNDQETVPIMSLGGKGIISVFANICPKEMHEIAAKYLSGDIQGSLSMHLHYLELMDALFMDVNPIPVKQALNMMGYSCGECRLPLVSMNEANTAKLRETLQRYGLVK